jgi:catechol 2,3-dioxygenase-like lactoylglutathione lyase family enzyme
MTSGQRPAIELEMIVIDTDDPARLSRFYSELLGMPVVREDEEWVSIRDDAGRVLAFQLAINHRPPTLSSGEVPQQYHLDLLVGDLEAACTYAESLGARRVRNAGGETYRVYLDPSGHPFCLTR